jgi:NAD-dependent deacetylase
MQRAHDIDAIAGWIAAADRVVTFSGAGLSKASGIPTYRDTGGLWKQGNNLKYSSADALASDPDGFRAFWTKRCEDMARAEPNAAHRAFAELGRLRPDVQHITQNVDGLLDRAGCVAVHELHGSLARWRCDACGVRALAALAPCPSCGQATRPDVVMFGEMLDDATFAAAELAAKRSQVCLVVGTTGVVQPAAGLVAKAASRSSRIVVVNVEASELDAFADATLRGPAEALVPALVAAVRLRPDGAGR